ncbi:efflux RND transporter periplasmic adaptor subunit [Singulisphaera acidiphila]|uniref:RND family efflux transporter, MFP subunit n=1 Tax=Singulisphaera acidiphila (strain ATCC BAA-1392 / DSM 18658 / VKM B-2454 / MOB10) TaxID=886293 RepID=L0DM05_SINAD|nr:efflux RND transporter periplasmic adaptor subunit [Singulisphaera acidiphila]AGA29863.1 RND family efflux transporter, MFP subunit [Singulisphaera acidiphila DSM 18658]
MSHHDRPRTRLARRVLSVSTAAIAILALVGCQKPVAPAPPPPPTVGVVESKRMSIPVLVTPNGTTRALEDVTIRARVRGFLTERHFDEGAFVKKGQLLLVIDEEPYKIALLLARARQAEAAAALRKSEVSKGREVALAQLELDRAQLLLANIQERRSRSLLARNAGSSEELDKAEADRKKWEAQVEADRANHEQASADFEVGIASARAQVAAANATVRDAELNLGYCRMVAPIDGRIGQAKVKVGNLVGPDAMGGGSFSDLATIQQLDPIGIDIRLSSRDLDRTRELIDQGLDVRLARSGPTGELEFPQVGTCYFIDNSIDETTSTFLAKARMPNPGGRLLPGEYVKLRLVVDRLENAIVVPAPSVMETEVGTIVHVVDGKGKVAVRKVDAAQTYEGMRVITKGLESGVSVIVEGLQSIRPGIVVKTAPAALARKTSEGSKITSALSSGAHTSQVESNLAGPPKS